MPSINGFKRLLKTGLGLLLCSCLWLTVSLPAIADEAPVSTSESATATPTISAVDIPAEKVDQFVSAYLSVTQLIEERGQDLQRAETEAESLQLERTVETDAIDLIKASGLTQQDYFQLLGLANTDPEFRDRVLAQLEERDG
ncbi:MAG: DUF4168 domain-containing protein [Cyanobacteria bacterium P01_D01_bin.115]